MKLNLIILFLLFISLNLMSSASEPIDEAASLYGKYSELQMTIKCSKPKGSAMKDFRRFSYKDAGFFKGGKWCDGKETPEGYYVFYNGKWYIWEKYNKDYDVMKTASLNGKYKNLMMTIKRPGDKYFYKQFVEYGHQPYGPRLGKWIQPAYYVYLYPHWYVWKEIAEVENIPENAYKDAKYIYTYSDLLQVVHCPKDKGQYGDHYEYGEYDAGSTNAYCGIYSIKGYWVYSYPYWYIWKSRVKNDN